MFYPRSNFSPCEFEGKIYLADPDKSHRSIETFDLTTERYTVFRVSLPPSLSHYSSAFICNGELTLLTHRNQIGQLRLREETEFRVSEASKPVYSSAVPVVYYPLVYMDYRGSGEIRIYSIERNDFLD